MPRPGRRLFRPRPSAATAGASPALAAPLARAATRTRQALTRAGARTRSAADAAVASASAWPVWKPLDRVPVPSWAAAHRVPVLATSGMLFVALTGAGVTAAVTPRPPAARPAAPVALPLPTAAAQPTPSVDLPTRIGREVQAAAAGRPAATSPLRQLPQVQVQSLKVAGIPPVALRAYVTAAKGLERTRPQCHLRWWLVAGIGFVESGHAHSGGSGSPRWNGVARPPIYGPTLDGSNGFAAIPDTDGGRLDGDPRWDRAVGPMQFIPSTWMTYGRVAPGGAVADPQDIRAAAMATGAYLCATGLDLATPIGMAGAVYAYNHSFDYVRLVLSVGSRYAGISPDALGVPVLPHDQPRALDSSALASPALGPKPRATPARTPARRGAPTPARPSTRVPAPPSGRSVPRPSVAPGGGGTPARPVNPPTVPTAPAAPPPPTRRPPAPTGVPTGVPTMPPVTPPAHL